MCFQCEHCQKRFSSLQMLEDHKANSSCLKCSGCKAKFASVDEKRRTATPFPLPQQRRRRRRASKGLSRLLQAATAAALPRAAMALRRSVPHSWPWR